MSYTRKLFLLLGIALLLTLAFIAQAQDDTVAVGDAIHGELSADEPEVRYTYEGQAGQIITIDLSSRDFDAYLQLLDSDGEELEANDDSAGLLDSQIGPFEIPADGTYTIVVTSSRHHNNTDQFATGTYTLRLSSRRTSPDSGTSSGNLLIIGDNISSNLSRAAGSSSYYFDARKGDEVVITVTSNDFDAYLTLLDPDQRELATDDDSAGSLNARIGPLLLPEDGRYSIVVTSYSSSQTAGRSGEFTLSLSAPGQDLISFNEEIVGMIPRDETSVSYNLRGEAGDTVVITVISNDVYAYVDLALSSDLDESLVSGQLYYESISAGSRIGPYTFPETAYYTLTISSYDDFGEFSLRVDQVTLQAIDYGDTLEVDIDSEIDVYYFSFEGDPGHVVNVLVDSDDEVDTQLTVNGPNGVNLTSDEDGGDGFDPEISRLILSEEGTHYILLESYLGDRGQVRLTLQQQVLASLDDGPQQMRLSGERIEDVVTFSAEAREKVRLNVAVLGIGNMTGEPYITVTQEGETIAYASVSNISKVTIEFTVPREGVVYVKLEDYSYSRASFELSLERVPDV
jgi:hypothetical protein